MNRLQRDIGTNIEPNSKSEIRMTNQERRTKHEERNKSRILALIACLSNSPGRKAGDHVQSCAIRRSIPGLPAWAINEFDAFRFVLRPSNFVLDSSFGFRSSNFTPGSTLL
jgi:hypothetical protein